MSARKKNISLVENLPNEPQAEVVQIEKTENKPDKPVKKVRNSLRQEWIEEIPVETAAPIATAQPTEPQNDVVMVEGDDLFEDPPDNPIDELLREIGSGVDDHKAVVYELPNYHRDGNSSIAHAETIFCGAVSIPPHFRTKGELLQLIQEKYAKPGKEFYDFSVVVKSRRIKRVLPVVRIRPIAGGESKPTQASGADNVISPVNQRDPLEELEKNAKVFERLKKIFGNDRAENPVIASGQPLTTEAAILKLVSDDPEKISRIADRFLGGKESDAPPSWLTALLPVAAPLITSLIERLTAQPPAAPAPLPAQIPAAHPAGQEQTEPPAEPPFAAKYRYLVGRILHGIENDLGGAFIGEEIAIHCDRDAQLDAAFLPFVGAPTLELKAQLASLSPKAATVLLQPNADQFLTDLQTYLKGEESEEG